MKSETLAKIEEKFKYFMKNKKLMSPVMKEEYLLYKKGKNIYPRWDSICNELKNYL